MTNSEERKKVSVGETLHQQRLDVALVTAGLCETRSQGQKLINLKKVFVNGKNEKASFKLQSGDTIEVLYVPPKSIELVPYDFPIEVIYEDEQVIVVNKPAGLVVHPAYGHESDTLINALLHRKTQLSPSEEFRPGLVHRIDKGTSGLLVLAKTETAHNHLAKQFVKKTIHRKYWAITFSQPKTETGKIESFLTRDPNHRQRYTSVKESNQGKWAVTHYKLLKSSKNFSLLELQLETGRTHQIRVHLSSMHLPIVGDDIYNGKNQAKNLKNQELKKWILEMSRFCLHAKELGFNHPTTHENLFFSSQIPEDLHFLFHQGGFSEFIGET